MSSRELFSSATFAAVASQAASPSSPDAAGGGGVMEEDHTTTASTAMMDLEMGIERQSSEAMLGGLIGGQQGNELILPSGPIDFLEFEGIPARVKKVNSDSPNSMKHLHHLVRQGQVVTQVCIPDCITFCGPIDPPTLVRLLQKYPDKQGRTIRLVDGVVYKPDKHRAAVWRVVLPSGPIGVSFDGNPAIVKDILEDSPLRSMIKTDLQVEQAIIPGVGKFSDLSAADLGNLLSDYRQTSGRVLVLRPSRAMLQRHLRLMRKSELLVHTDPFAPREGKTLVWKNVNMAVAGKGKDEEETNKDHRMILDNVWGEVPQKQTTAIMGPSGAGKSSLLNVLAGRASSHGNVTITSDIRLNNYAVDPTNMAVRKLIAFVAQDDSLQVTSTPREAIRFSAKLRLPRSTTESQLDKLCERMITELGLTSCADTIVGGELIKGISGGERKRTSVGVELVVKPALVFLDEPTSGLDSYSAVQLCQVLKKVANAGSSVLFTIHQPSSEIFQAFDSLILMNRGKVMYQGPVANVNPYFAERNQPCPPNYNPADWIMNVAQSVPLKQLEEQGFFPRDTRDMEEAFIPEEGKDALGITITRRSLKGGTSTTESSALNSSAPPGFLTQVDLLFRREIVNFYRNTVALGARFGLTIFLSILIGVIFLDVGNADPTNPSFLSSHFGALIMVMLMSMFSTAQPALLAFPEERPVFLREYSTNHYSVVAYFISRFAMEAFVTAAQVFILVLITYFMIGFHAGFGIFYLNVYVLAMASTALAVLLGSAVEDPKLGQEMLPILFVPQMLFAGFFVTPSLIPSWLGWAQYLCTLTYGVRIMMVEEFWDCGGTDPESQASRNCNNLVLSIDADPDDTWWYWIVLMALFAGFRITALIVLRIKATKFL